MAVSPVPRLNHTTIKRRRTKPPSDATSSFNSLLMEPPPYLLPSKAELPRLFALVIIAVSVAVVANYFATCLYSRPKPFCDSDTDYAFSLSSDSCEPCPSHGECHQGKLECARGYRKVGKLCIEDGDIIKTAKKLSELVERRVCEAYSQYLCDGYGAAWTQEGKLWSDIDESMLKGNFSLDVYAFAKQRAIETSSKLFESRINAEGSKELRCPQFLVGSYMPVTCFIRQWMAKHAMVLVPLCVLLTGSVLIILRLRQKFFMSSRGEQLYSQVCDILEEHALMSRSSNSEVEPWVVASWLRDHLLLPKERKNPMLWKKVEELVQEDSRLDRYPKIVKGESKVVWEWQVEGSLSSSKKRKKAEVSKNKASEGTGPSKQTNIGDRELVSC